MAMRKRFILYISLLICAALLFAIGYNYQKAEEQQKTALSAVAPTSPQSPGGVDSTVSPPAQGTLPEPAPSPEKLGVPPTAPEAGAPAVPPQAPGIPGVQAPPAAIPVKPLETGIVRVAGFNSAQIQNGAPTGWLLDRNKGTPDIKLEKGSDIYCLHMRSDSESSFGIKKGIKINIKEFPYLNWRWKAVRLPDGGDVRNSDKDDQAMQLYVAFTPSGFPEVLNTPVLGYIWDYTAPKGWTGRSSQIGGGKLKYVVIRNNTDQLGLWYTEKRNIYEDYKNLFKDVKSADPPGLTYGVQFHINSHHTGSGAESYICEVYFSKS
jgi:hypothetical protein